MSTSDKRSTALGLRVLDIHGFGSDPDLQGFTGEEPVHIEMIDTYPDDGDRITDVDKMLHYEMLYRKHGPWALPPVVCLGDDGWQIAGAHRMEAAWRARLERVPAFIILDKWGECER